MICLSLGAGSLICGFVIFKLVPSKYFEKIMNCLVMCIKKKKEHLKNDENDDNNNIS